MVNNLSLIVIHAFLVLALSPLLFGIINKTKAIAAGRQGPPILQTYFDLWKILHKEMVLSQTTTWIFLGGPIISVVAYTGASLLVPIGFHATPIAFEGDIILFGYLFALSRFFTVVAALDTGSSFEGMGAAREVTFSSFAEPAVFLMFIALAKMTGSLSLSSLLLSPSPLSDTWEIAVIVLISLTCFIVLLAENCRIPFDDPNTHLELTMIHEVMVLDHSGPAFGLIILGSAVKLFLTASIFVSIIMAKLTPASVLGWPLYLLALSFCCVLVGLVESSMARLRLPSVPKLLVVACLLSTFTILLLMR